MTPTAIRPAVESASDLAIDLPICRTCAVQYPDDVDRKQCKICSDERQYVKASGQQWTSLREMAAEGYAVDVHEEVPGLWGVGTAPTFGIGQRGLLIPGDGAKAAVIRSAHRYFDHIGVSTEGLPSLS